MYTVILRCVAMLLVMLFRFLCHGSSRKIFVHCKYKIFWFLIEALIEVAITLSKTKYSCGDLDSTFIEFWAEAQKLSRIHYCKPSNHTPRLLPQQELQNRYCDRNTIDPNCFSESHCFCRHLCNCFEDRTPSGSEDIENLLNKLRICTTKRLPHCVSQK